MKPKKPGSNIENFLANPSNPLSQENNEDFANAVGSFSSKSINTYDESNQSVAQELKTNESIAFNTYGVSTIKYNGSSLGNQRGVNSQDDAGEQPLPKNIQHGH